LGDKPVKGGRGVDKVFCQKVPASRKRREPSQRAPSVSKTGKWCTKEIGKKRKVALAARESETKEKGRGGEKGEGIRLSQKPR